jgi:hypothetical protein
MPTGTRWPFCGMNFAFPAWALPYMYFPKMGQNTPYRRFDDIWCGLVMQLACESTNHALSVGGPVIDHQQAASVASARARLIAEAPGIDANDMLWELFDSWKHAPTLREKCAPVAALTKIAVLLQAVRDIDLPPSSHAVNRAEFLHYLHKLAGWLADWLDLCTDSRGLT